MYTLNYYSAFCVHLANTHISLAHERYTRRRPLRVDKVLVLNICSWLTVYCETLRVACVYTWIYYPAMFVRLADTYISLKHDQYTKHRSLRVDVVLIL
jgi:hypothetical protein